MKKLLLSGLILCAAGTTSTAFADTAATATAGSAAYSQAENNNGGDGGTAYNSLSFKSSSSPPPPGTPVSVSGPTALPSLFNMIGRPAQVSGIPMQSKNFFSLTNHSVKTGKSGGTKIVYNGSTPASRKDIEERDVFFDFSGVSQGELVGSITIQSKKSKADEVDLHTLIFDATQFVADVEELRGYDITLLSLPQAITWGLGVDSKSDGFSVSPLVSSLLNGPTGMLAGLASGFSQTGGVTVPTGIVGCTFLVLIDSDNSKPIDIRRSYANGNDNGNGSENGHGDGKKLEAIKSQETK